MSRIAATALVGRALHRQDFAGDLLGRLGGLHRERFHFGGNHREAAPGVAGARRLDGGVERQQIGLAGDILNELDHVADLLRHLRQRGNVVIGGAGIGNGAAHHLVGLHQLAADLLDRDRKFGRRRGRGLDIGRRFVGAVHRAFGAVSV